MRLLSIPAGKQTVATVLALFLGTAVGCGGSENSNPETYPVSGVVKLNGTAVSGATVMFLPMPGSEGQSATGKTDESGKYQLTTFAANDGALPGKYQVTIVKYEQPAETAATGQGGDGVAPAIAEDADYAPPSETEAAAAPPKNLLPAKYENASQSGLTAEVTAGENTPKDFQLTEG